MSSFTKPIPKSILIFGAAAHIGRPLAEYLTREAPTIKLRLATSSPKKQNQLRSAFPNAEVVDANYNDVDSLSAAVEGIEGVFVITPAGLSEEPAMTNLVTALEKANSVVHIIRLQGVFPEISTSRITRDLSPRSLPIQHPIAKRILDASGLPVTYINCGATFMDNFHLQIKSVQARKTLIWPEHRVPFMDPRDIGEVAARLFLSDNARHIGAFHTMNNGQDWLTFREVASIVSEMFGEPVGYDGSFEAWSEFYMPIMGPHVIKDLWNFFKFEEANEECWALNNFVERTLGRKPTSVKGWLLKHKEVLKQTTEIPAWAAQNPRDG
ncbi:hypothetical protein Daus18300_010322 [Diaporthe australafricana]|uniref:NmrA-like domain-containing protein n=1 Tax=Diaporthe australafricana TaxID=127596 RepID=A0ABR3WB32_9PEZI